MQTLSQRFDLKEVLASEKASEAKGWLGAALALLSDAILITVSEDKNTTIETKRVKIKKATDRIASGATEYGVDVQKLVQARVMCEACAKLLLPST